MPTFTYKAKDGPDNTIEGEIIADNRAAVLAEIDRRGQSPISVTENAIDERSSHEFISARIRARDINIFTRQLASLLRAGVPILRALVTIGEQTENKKLLRVVTDLGNTIRDGGMLSEALKKYPRLFPGLYVSMVKSGESAGILDKILRRLAEAREKEEVLRRKVQSALTYPTLVLIVGIATVFVMVAFFMPRIMPLFKGQELPLPTAILFGASKIISGSWHWLVIGVMLFILMLKRMISGGAGRTMWDAIQLSMPVLRGFSRNADIARFARTLSLLIESGITIDRALALSSETMRNSILKQEIEEVRVGVVHRGARIADGMKHAKHFPVFLSNMIAVGEETGGLEEVLAEVAEFYDQEVDQQTRTVTTLIEPLLILIIGAVVGLIVFAMLLPIFEIGKTIG